MWDLGSASPSANKAKNTTILTEEEAQRQPVCQQISVVQNKLFQETAVNKMTLDPWVGLGSDGSTTPWWVAEACCFWPANLGA